MSSPCICTTLRSASRRMAAFYDEVMAPVGVNIAQFSLMRTIKRAEPVTLTELGRLTELDRSTIGRNVRVIEKLGLVTLGRGKDQREAVVQITEAGQKVLDDGAPLWDGAQQTLDERLGADTMRILRTLLDSL
ncbi:MarR family winged helix-turn-helix transcriptional regulator [Bosea sp. BK604]|uniref:MarR family winged helix-turn-helix transcriptional regulator n=1 Tax=Bosea sp. BK604 TaxID=2512180 RepID=UPI001043284D|nr:MarR family winged helix-turn-helix transcriptional regulator [Bosea sp. BK604]